jgi:biopolymer transport protein ExbB
VLTQLIELWERVLVFIETGGDVLVFIFVVTLVMWMLIVERIWYFRLIHPRDAQKALVEWKARTERTSWEAEQIRRQQISELSLKLNRSLSTIKTLIALCPLLGLLGTVTGMIEVFDIMSMVGSGNTRAMASGVSMATIPTMAGMVAALSGMYFIARLDQLVKSRIAKVEDLLVLERGEVCVVE